MKTGLTSYRAIAFMAVFLHHMAILPVGYLGVQGFFVLSGFLLTPILLEMKDQLESRKFFINFYGRRALRIFPLYYIYLLLIYALVSTSKGQEIFGNFDAVEGFLKQLPWAFTYTYDFYFASVFAQKTSFLSHFWSLAVEEQFYLIWPLLIFLVPKKQFKKFLLLVILSGPIIRFLISLIVSGNILPILKSQVDLVVYYLPFSHVDAFAIGGYFALFQKEKPRHSTWIIILSTIILGYLTALNLADQNSFWNFGYAPFMKNSYKYIWGYSVLNFTFAYILNQIDYRRFMPLIFENKIMAYLGKISYGLYVFHYPIIWLMFNLNILPGQPYGLRWLVIGILSLLLTVLISTISYELMEKRFIKLKDKFFPKSVTP